MVGFFLGEYRGEFLVSFWEFDLCHSCFPGKFRGNGGFVNRYCGEFPIQFLEFVDGWCYAFSLEIVNGVFIGVGGFFPDVLLGMVVGVGWGGGHVSLYNFICSIVVWGSVCVVWDVYHSFGPVDFRVDFLQPRCP